mgnify:CR=1 FL=1
MQNIPIRTELGRQIRDAFVAEPGHKLLSADYSQVELRILAHVSGEPKLREAFERHEDIHTATAAEVLGKNPATLTKDERNVAKMVNFGIIYGISAFGLSENLEMPREDAQAYMKKFFANVATLPLDEHSTFIRAYFSGAGYRVQSAAGGSEALEAMHQARPRRGCREPSRFRTGSAGPRGGSGSRGRFGRSPA